VLLFILNNLIAGLQVMVDIVERGSPAYFSKIKKGDILVAVQGTKVTSLSHASKLLKSSFKRFTIRIERKRCLINHQVRKNKIKVTL